MLLKGPHRYALFDKAVNREKQVPAPQQITATTATTLKDNKGVTAARTDGKERIERKKCFNQDILAKVPIEVNWNTARSSWDLM